MNRNLHVLAAQATPKTGFCQNAAELEERKRCETWYGRHVSVPEDQTAALVSGKGCDAVRCTPPG